MTRRRWIADEISGNRAALTGDHATHLARVLRARVGQEFDIALPDGVRLGRITHVGDSRVEFELGEAVNVKPSSDVTILLSIFKFDRMEWAIEKCTELGAARIVPVIASRTESHLAKAAEKRHERWERIARQASEQSRRVSPPQISLPFKLNDAIALPGSARIVLAESEKGMLLKNAIPPDGEVLLAFGPEGGWADAEIKQFEQSGWISASLGDTILRAETAAIAATAIVLAVRS